MSKYSTPQGAMRLARTIASDIKLYNKDKIAAGIKGDNLFEALEAEIAEGHRHFDGKVTDAAIREQFNYVDRALVDVLIATTVDVETNIW